MKKLVITLSTALRGGLCSASLLSLVLVPVVFSGCSRSEPEPEPRFQVGSEIDESSDPAFVADDMVAQPRVQDPAAEHQFAGLPIEIPEGDADELGAFLANLEVAQQRARSREEYISAQITRVEAARRMWDVATEDRHRFHAARFMVDALLKKLALQLPGAEPQLRAQAQQFAQDEQPEVAQVGRVALLSLAIGELARAQQPDTSEIQQMLDQLIVDFPTSSMMANELQDALAQLLNLGHRDLVMSTMRRMRDVYKATDEDDMHQIGQVMEDRVLLLELEFDLLAQELMDRNISGERFLQAIRQGLETGSGTAPMLMEVLGGAQWLEDLGKGDDALAAFRMLEQRRQQVAPEEEDDIWRAVRMEIDAALTRLQLEGTQFPFEGVNLQNERLDPEHYRDQVVVVILWSAGVTDSFQAMAHLNALLPMYEGRPLRMLGVNVDDNPSMIREIFRESPFSGEVIVRSLPDQPSIDQQLGIRRFPYIVIVDRSGKIAHNNVSIVTLKEKIDQVLDRQPPTDNTPAVQPQTPPATDDGI